MYEYHARIIRVVDGDTVEADLDLGCDVHVNLMLRLLGINAPEHGTTEGEVASVSLRGLVGAYSEGGRLLVRTEKDRTEKYGRYLATLVGWHSDGTEQSLNVRMIELGHAVPYDGGPR